MSDSIYAGAARYKIDQAPLVAEAMEVLLGKVQPPPHRNIVSQLYRLQHKHKMLYSPLRAGRLND